jgi:predicted ABC-type ATPase
MKLFIGLILFFLLSCQSQVDNNNSTKSHTDILQANPKANHADDTTYLDEFYVDSISIGRKSLNKIEVFKNSAVDSNYVVIKFYSKHKAKWILKKCAQKQDFAFETTLSSRSIVGLINQAKEHGYRVNLIYYWLDSIELAIERVKIRVSEGGHHIPTDTIIRRYYAGLKNFINLYRDKVHYWMLIDNSQTEPQLIAEGSCSENSLIVNEVNWQIITNIIQDDTDRHKG